MDVAVGAGVKVGVTTGVGVGVEKGTDDVVCQGDQSAIVVAVGNGVDVGRAGLGTGVDVG